MAAGMTAVHTSLEDAGEGPGAALQVEADVQVQHVREGVVRHAPSRRLPPATLA